MCLLLLSGFTEARQGVWLQVAKCYLTSTLYLRTGGLLQQYHLKATHFFRSNYWIFNVKVFMFQVLEELLIRRDCGATFCFGFFIPVLLFPAGRSQRGLVEHCSSTPISTADYTPTLPISISDEWNPHLPASFGATGILTVPANISQVPQNQY